MSFAASVSLDEARALLNDPSGATYTDVKLLPYLKRAYEELSNNLALQEVPLTLGRTAAITVTAGSTTLTAISGMLMPVFLEERAPGDATYMDMIPRVWEPDIQPGSTLGFWTWREENIRFPAATANREVRVTFIESLTQLTDGTSLVLASNANGFLAAKTASLVATFIMNNPKKAEALNQEAGRALSILISLAVKGNQLLSVRRRPYGTARRLLRGAFKS